MNRAWGFLSGRLRLGGRGGAGVRLRLFALRSGVRFRRCLIRETAGGGMEGFTGDSGSTS